MTSDISTTIVVEGLLDRVRRGDDRARDELLGIANDRLLTLARHMLQGYPTVQRFDETSDVYQNAAVRLFRALEDVEVQDANHFFRLAAVQIRRELLDLARRYQGPLGPVKNEVRQQQGVDDPTATTPRNHLEYAEETNDPRRLAQWTEFHEAVDALPEVEREVFRLHWYCGLKLKDVAEMMGYGERQIKRYWRQARLSLADSLEDQP
ncbi:MAG: sigma-70 family RNA polymerase sigma factor [Pirellulales bacterium]